MLDDQLYYKTIDGVLLKCLNQEEAKVLMGEVHEGICGAHQLAYKMKWIIRRTGYSDQQYCGGYTPGYHKMVHGPHHPRWPGP